MKTCRDLPRILLIPALVLGALPAQSESEPARHGEPSVSLEFRGGTLFDYAKTIRAAAPHVNIVLPAMAADVEIPEIKLTEAPVLSALRAVGSIVIDHAVDVQALPAKVGEPVYAVSVRPVLRDGSSKSSERPRDNRSVSVVSLKGLTEPMPDAPEGTGLAIDPETILTAIDAGLAIASKSAKKAEVRYHADSGLLFVNGTPEQNAIVQQVVGSMESDLERRRLATRRAAAHGGGPAPGATNRDEGSAGRGR